MRRDSEAGVEFAGLELQAADALDAAFGPGEEPATATAPGRCTLAGEHVDYAGGRVLCVAIDLYVVAAVRRAASGSDRVAVGARRHERSDPLRPADGGYVFAAADAVRGCGHAISAIDAATVATLPAGAGLGSSAAVICATQVALLRTAGDRVGEGTLIDLAYEAEHDILGVPSGRLDQHAIVQSPDGGAILLDCLTDSSTAVPWALDNVVLCVCDTSERHRVAGTGYRARRAETEAALRRAGAANAQQLAFATAGPLGGFDSLIPGTGDVLTRRLRHIVTETRRATAAADALRAGDAELLGALMSASHRSLRDDHEVSTPLLDSVVAAARSVRGCYGARLVGAGFGGSVVALAESGAAPACTDAMRHTAGVGAQAWITRPSAGLAFTASDAVTRG